MTEKSCLVAEVSSRTVDIMHKRQLVLLLAFALVFLVGCSPSSKGPYDAQADPSAEFAGAMKRAEKDGKRVLIVFGANWCPDCRVFERKLTSRAVYDFVRENFFTMHVDIGNWDRNMDFAAKLGKPIEKGIPSIVIVGKDGNVLYATAAGQIAAARKMTPQVLLKWLSDPIRKNVGEP